jgi:hypothetical protein
MQRRRQGLCHQLMCPTMRRRMQRRSSLRGRGSRQVAAGSLKLAAQIQG